MELLTPPAQRPLRRGSGLNTTYRSIIGPLQVEKNGVPLRVDSGKCATAKTDLSEHLLRMKSVNSRLMRGPSRGVLSGVLSGSDVSTANCVALIRGIPSLATVAKTTDKLHDDVAAVLEDEAAIDAGTGTASGGKNKAKKDKKANLVKVVGTLKRPTTSCSAQRTLSGLIVSSLSARGGTPRTNSFLRTRYGASSVSA
eukprot:Amastigsp_a842340_27.p1 type:complete len:198 gc:universal Amastigsp_a842340_27:550-1143(+)